MAFDVADRKPGGREFGGRRQACDATPDDCDVNEIAL
jgi:hypothetical protein